MGINCPSHLLVLKKDECKRAASQLGLTSPSEQNLKYRPAGCYWFDDKQNTSAFNTHSDPSPIHRKTSGRICRMHGNSFTKSNMNLKLL